MNDWLNGDGPDSEEVRIVHIGDRLVPLDDDEACIEAAADMISDEKFHDMCWADRPLTNIEMHFWNAVNHSDVPTALSRWCVEFERWIDDSYAKLGTENRIRIGKSERDTDETQGQDRGRDPSGN